MNFTNGISKITFLYSILTSSFLIQSMERTITAPLSDVKHTVTTSSDKISTLKDLCAKHLSAGNIELVTAEQVLCSEQKEHLKDTLIREHLFFFIDLFKDISYKKVDDAHVSVMHAAAFSPDGNYFVTGSQNGDVLLWDINDPFIAQKFGLPHLPVHAIAFSPDSRFLLTGYNDGITQLRDLTQNPHTSVTLPKHEDIFAFNNGFPVKTTSFSADGTYAMSASCAAAHFWDLRQTPPHLAKDVPVVGSTKFSADGRYILSGLGFLLTLRDLHHPINKYIPDSHAETISTQLPNQIISRVALSSDNKYALAASLRGDKAPVLINLQQGRTPQKLTIPEHCSVHALTFDSQARYAFILVDNGTVELWDLQNKSISNKASVILRLNGGLRDLPPAFEGYTPAIAFSPDGRYVVVVWKNDFHIWDFYGPALSLTLPMLQILVSLKNKPELIQNAQVQQALMKFPENLIKPIFAYFKQNKQ